MPLRGKWVTTTVFAIGDVIWLDGGLHRLRTHLITNAVAPGCNCIVGLHRATFDEPLEESVVTFRHPGPQSIIINRSLPFSPTAGYYVFTATTDKTTAPESRAKVQAVLETWRPGLIEKLIRRRK